MTAEASRLESNLLLIFHCVDYRQSKFHFKLFPVSLDTFRWRFHLTPKCKTNLSRE